MYFEVLAVLLGDALQREQPIAAHDLGGVGFLARDDDAQELHRNAQMRVDPRRLRAAIDYLRQRADLAVNRMLNRIGVDLLTGQLAGKYRCSDRCSARDDAQTGRGDNRMDSQQGTSPLVGSTRARSDDWDLQPSLNPVQTIGTALNDLV